MKYCDHKGHGQTLVKKYDKNGRVLYRWKCLNCHYAQDKSLSHKYVLENFDVDKVPEYSDREYSNYMERLRRHRREEREAWWNLYNEYLLSPEWRERRGLVFRRDLYACIYCGQKADQVHHHHYRNVFKEPLEDLASVCEPCHKKIHTP